MAKKAYIGVDNVARKVKNIYVGAGVNTYQKTVTATEFQQGALLYSSGNLDTSFTDYVSTTNFYEASYGNVVKIISSKVTPLEDSGFLWYDSNHNFISGNKGTVSGQFVNGEPPVNTAYFKFNLNAASVTPSTASGTGFAVYSVARKIKKAYIGDENGLARLCWSAGIPYVSGTITTTSNSTKLSIANLSFKPTFAFILYTSSSTVCPKMMGLHGDTVFWDNYGEMTKRASGYDTVTYGDDYVTVQCVTNSYSFIKGTYKYVIVGGTSNDGDIAFGNINLQFANAKSFTIDGLSFTPNKAACIISIYQSNSYATVWGVWDGNKTITTDSNDYGAWLIPATNNSISTVFNSNSVTFNSSNSRSYFSNNRGTVAHYVVWREE